MLVTGSTHAELVCIPAQPSVEMALHVSGGGTRHWHVPLLSLSWHVPETPPTKQEFQTALIRQSIADPAVQADPGGAGDVAGVGEA